jgi:transcriptional regulator with XRE-family HTH domain
MQVKELTSSQLIAARAVLGWSINELANRTGIGSATIKRYEAADGIPKSRKGHLLLLRTHFEAVGIEFIGSLEDRPGIRIGKPRQ